MTNYTILLNKSSNIPLYKQLYSYMKNEIDNKRLEAFSRLPSIRSLSKDLGVSKTTIESAYYQLMEEGYIEGKSKSGYYVIDCIYRTQKKNTPATESKSKNMNVKDHNIKYDFNSSKIDAMSFPISVFNKLSNEVLKEKDPFTFYGEPQGETTLRKQIAIYLYRNRTVYCQPEQIVICSGTEHSIGLLSGILRTNYHSIAVEDPGFSNLHKIFMAHQYKILPIQLENDGININQLKSYKNKNLLYITPSHQYPLGMNIPMKKRIQLLEWAEETDSYIIEDDYDGEFRYNVNPIPSLQGLDVNGRVIYVGTFSKSLSPALRISYLVLPKQILDQYHNYNMYPSTVPVYLQRTLSLFMEKGHWDRHIRKMRSLYGKKHELLIQSIKESMGKNVKILGDHAGLHITLEIQHNLNDRDLIARAKEAGVKVYSVTKQKNMNQSHSTFPTIIIGFGGLSFDEITNGIHALNSAWFYRLS